MAVWPEATFSLLPAPAGVSGYQLRITPGAGRLIQARADGVMSSATSSDELLRLVDHADMSEEALTELLRTAAMGEPMRFIRSWRESDRPGLLTMTEHLECQQLASVDVPLTAPAK
jgi:hypothetical protein